MTFAARLVAYSPGGARLSSLLLDAVDWDASFPHDDVAALSLSYPSVADAAAELVDGPVEIAVEVSDGGAWVAQLELPRRPGVTSRRQSWGLGTVKLSIAVIGKPGVPVAQSTQVLVALLSRASSVTRKAGSRSLTADVVTSVVSEPRRISAEGAWIVECTFMVSPFWWQGNAVTSAVKLIPGDVVFAEWAGTTGDVVDGILRVRGPLTRFSAVADDGAGLSFIYTLLGSQYAYLDPVNVRAWRGGASQWTPSTVSIPLDWPAEGPLVLPPGSDGVALTVTAEGADSETSAMVLRGRKWWL